MSAATTAGAPPNGKIVAHHYGAAGYDLAPLLPMLFVRDFVHLVFPAGASAVDEGNPNRALFRIVQAGQQVEVPDLVSVAAPLDDARALSANHALVLESAICIVVRSAFKSLYAANSVLPSALSGILERRFRFAGFLHPLMRATGAGDAAVGGLPTHGDAVFLTDPSDVMTNSVSADERYLKTLKLAFLSIAVGQISHGVEVLRQASQASHISASPALEQQLRFRNYPRLLRHVASAADRSSVYLQVDAAPASQPPGDIIARMNGLRLLQRRAAGALAALRGRIPSLLWVPEMWAREWDPMAYWMLPLSARRGLGLLRRLWRAWKALSTGVALTVPFTPGPDTSRASPLETLLDANGFWVVARESYATRMSRPRHP